MTQSVLDSDTIVKIQTPIERLRALRMDYYIELLNEMTTLRNKRIELIRNYKFTITDIDKQIEIEKFREKKKKLEAQKIQEVQKV